MGEAMRSLRVPTLSMASLMILLFAEVASAAPGDLGLSGFYSEGLTTWVIVKWASIITVSVGAGAAVYLSAGTATPLVSSVGTWIGTMAGLSGAAATSYGLAFVGGGSIAAGGLGMKGGAAILTAALSLSGSVTKEVADTAVEAAKEWVTAQPAASSSDTNTGQLGLPLPRVALGSSEHVQAIRELTSRYKKVNWPKEFTGALHVDALSDLLEVNRKIVDHARKLSSTASKEETHPAIAASVATGRALLALHNGDRVAARTESARAISIMKGDPSNGPSLLSSVEFWDDLRRSALPDGRFARNMEAARRKYNELRGISKRALNLSLPTAIWSIATAADHELDLKISIAALKSMLAWEPDHELVPLIVAAHLNSTSARKDFTPSRHIRLIYEALVEEKSGGDRKYAVIAGLASRALFNLELNGSIIRMAERGDFKGKKLRGRESSQYMIELRQEQRQLVALADTLIAGIKDRVGVDQARVHAFRTKVQEHAAQLPIGDPTSGVKNNRK